MTTIPVKNPQFIYRKNDETGEAVIFCTRPVQFKAYVFLTPESPGGFRLMPEKDTEQIRKVMKRMNEWFCRWQSVQNH